MILTYFGPIIVGRNDIYYSLLQRLSNPYILDV